MANPLLDDHLLPPFKSIRAEHIEPAIEELLARNRSMRRQLLSEGKSGWNDLIRVLEENDAILGNVFAPVRHMNSVVNSPEIREAYNAALPLLSEYFTEMKQDPRLFAEYKQIAAGPEYRQLDQAAQKAVDNAIRDFKLTGIDLPAQQQARFAEISRRLSELASKVQ